MPFSIEGIVWYSEDLDRARAFYRDVLGLSLLLDEGHVIHFDAGTVRLAIHRCRPERGGRPRKGSSFSGWTMSPQLTRNLANGERCSSEPPPSDRTVGWPTCMT